MSSSIENSLHTVCKILEEHKVEYMVVGGAAVALYGYSRMSVTSVGVPAEKPDLDFWYNPTYDNYFNLLKAIGDLGQDVSAFIKEKAPNPRKSFFKLNFPAYTVDFLPMLPGLSQFNHSYMKREVVQTEGLSISFINFDDLITNKQALLRENDISDIAELKKRRKG